MNIHEIERQWRSSSTISDRQLMAAFPDAASLLVTQMKKMRGRVKLLELGIQLKRKAMRTKVTDEFALWCYDQSLDLAYGQELRSLQQRIAITKRRLNILLGVVVPGQLTDEAIAHAKDQPIERLLSVPMRTIGKRLMGKCPLHKDETPSLVVYKSTNTAWCFGCQQGGDSIKLVQLLHGYNFKQAVNYINNH